MDLNSIQKQVGDIWTDDKGKSVPRKYLSNEQVFDEANVFRAFSIAKKLQEHMLKQKKDLRKISASLKHRSNLKGI